MNDLTQTIFNGPRVSVEQMAGQRSARAAKQKELLSQGGEALLCLSLNIPGPVKQFPLSRRAFREGMEQLNGLLPRQSILSSFVFDTPAGSEGLLLLSCSPQAVKRDALLLEEHHPLGRLFDIDVLAKDGTHLSRADFGLAPRRCLLCEKDARVCGRSRAHTVEALQEKVASILLSWQREALADAFTSCVSRALLYEAAVTPKPGLVDRANSGAHADMDYFTFLDSTSALLAHFRSMFLLGWERSEEPEEAVFSHLRFLGRQAEAKMLCATGGVNTHKGLIFSMGIFSAAAGMTFHDKVSDENSSLHQVLSRCRRMGTCSLKDYQNGPDASGSTKPAGARAQAASGFSLVTRTGLPALCSALRRGFSINAAAAVALLALIAAAKDSNLIRRAGKEQAEYRRKQAAEIGCPETEQELTEQLRRLDREYIAAGISPGGCADLLAMTLLLYFLSREGLLPELCRS